MRAVCWSFAGCVLDERTLELTVGGQLVKLEPKPLEMLKCLLRHAGEVVTKDELQEEVWPGRILSESVLSKAMAKLRLGLGDEEQQIIRTVHGYGYRLIAAVQAEYGAALRSAPQLDLSAGGVVPRRPDWRLVELLGRGGHGEVWLAEHDRTHTRRVFKFALDAPGLSAIKREITLWRVLQQTHGERRDLLRLLDWNLEEPPYFIETEHVRAGALQQWAQQQGGLESVPLSLRIELVAQVAEALAAAHAAGVLHKDLKPSNLLIDVDPQGIPRIKLGDFGSGRLIDLARNERLEITRMGFTRTVDGSDQDADGTSGTPFYFAPELIAGQQPTVQTDIYALGVILYQVVVGDLKRPLAPGWEQDIDNMLLREDIATAAAGRAAERLSDAAELARRLRDLEARQARRREELVAEAESRRLRLILERSHLRRKWIRALVTVLLAGICATSFSLWRADRERQRAEIARDESRAALHFLSEDMLAATDPFGGGRPSLSLHDLLDEVAPKLVTQLSRFPSARAEIGFAMGRAYEGLGDWNGARQRLETAYEEAQDTLGEEADLSLSIAGSLAYVSLLQSRFEESEQLYEKVYRIQRDRLGDKHPDTLAIRDGMAWLEYERGHYAVAAQRYEALIKDYGDSDPLGLTSVRWSLADCLLELNRNATAEKLMRTVIADTTALQGANHPRVLWQMTTLGDALMMQGHYDEAAQIFDQAYVGLVAIVGEVHPYTLIALHFRGTLLLERGEPAAALPLLQRAYENRLAIHGEDHVWTRFSANRVGEALTQLGRVSEALPLLEKTYTAAVAAQGLSHPNVLMIVRSYADALIAAGRDDDAELLLQGGLAGSQVTLPPENLRIAYLHQSLGELRSQQQRTEDAKREFAAAHAIYVTALGAAHPITLRAAAQLRRI